MDDKLEVKHSDREREWQRDVSGCAFGRQHATLTRIGQLVAAVCLVLLTFVLIYVVLEQHETHAVLVEQVRSLQVEIADIKEHGSPISAQRLAVLEAKVK